MIECFSATEAKGKKPSTDAKDFCHNLTSVLY